MKRLSVIVVTAADGSATKDTPRIAGAIHSIRYIKPGANSYADTVDFAVTDVETGEVIWQQSNVTASATVRPRAPVHSTLGVALLYAASGEPVAEPVAVVGKMRFVLAQGGNAKTGTFHVFYK